MNLRMYLSSLSDPSDLFLQFVILQVLSKILWIVNIRKNQKISLKYDVVKSQRQIPQLTSCMYITVKVTH